MCTASTSFEQVRFSLRLSRLEEINSERTPGIVHPALTILGMSSLEISSWYGWDSCKSKKVLGGTKEAKKLIDEWNSWGIPRELGAGLDQKLNEKW